MMEATKCPNCSASYDPTSRQCEYCGSYIIFTSQKSENYEVSSNRTIYFNNILLQPGEYPVRSGLANLRYSATSSDGGQLLLTNKRLVFVAHSLNLNPNLEWEIDLNFIEEVRIGKNYLITQILNITTNDDEIQFVVYKGKEWVKEIVMAV